MTVPEWDAKVSLYTADADGTLMPLVELAQVPTDGTWEVMHGIGMGWRLVTDANPVPDHLARVLVVARPIEGGDW